MAIRLRHDVAAGLVGAYASGLANAQRRKQKYALDQLLLDRRHAQRMEALGGARLGSSRSRTGLAPAGKWIDPIAEAGSTDPVYDRARRKAAMRKYRLGKGYDTSVLPYFKSQDEIDRERELKDEERRRQQEREDYEWRKGVDEDFDIREGKRKAKAARREDRRGRRLDREEEEEERARERAEKIDASKARVSAGLDELTPDANRRMSEIKQAILDAHPVTGKTPLSPEKYDEFVRERGKEMEDLWLEGTQEVEGHPKFYTGPDGTKYENLGDWTRKEDPEADAAAAARQKAADAAAKEAEELKKRTADKARKYADDEGMDIGEAYDKAAKDERELKKKESESWDPIAAPIDFTDQEIADAGQMAEQNLREEWGPREALGGEGEATLEKKLTADEELGMIQQVDEELYKDLDPTNLTPDDIAVVQGRAEKMAAAMMDESKGGYEAMTLKQKAQLDLLQETLEELM